MIALSQVEKMILKAIPGAVVTVSDMTGTGDHLEITVTSEKFKGLSLVDQHKLVHRAVESEMDQGIHAIKVKTKTH